MFVLKNKVIVHSDALVIQQLKGGGPFIADRLINKIGTVGMSENPGGGLVKWWA